MERLAIVWMLTLMEAVSSMNPALLAGGAVSVVLLVAFAVVLRSLVAARRDEPVAASALPEVRSERYRPMVRLLSAEDLEFLKDQAGYTPELGRRLMAERRRLMRAYLRALSNDFNAVYTAATQLLMMSPEDQPELASELGRQRIAFSRNIAIAHFNLCLNAFGVGEVNVVRLVDALTFVEHRFNHLADAAVARSVA